MYTPTRQITAFPVAGFKYYEGPMVLSKLKPGKKLKLVPEFDNPYDPNAIALYYKGQKIGFVPRDENYFIAQCIRFGHKKVFEARVIQVDKQARPSNQVSAAIYIVDKR